MADQRKDLMKRFYDEILNQGNLDRIPELCTEDMVDHEAPPGMPEGLEGVKTFIETFRTGFPDIQVEVESAVEEGDMVAARCRVTGTHEGEFLGVPPSHNRIDIEWIDMVRVEGDKCAEHWGVSDNLAMMQQIGAVPETAT